MKENSKKNLVHHSLMGIFSVAVVMMFVLFPSCKEGSKDAGVPTKTQLVTLEDGTVVEREIPLVPVAYIQMDSIYALYNFLVDKRTSLQSSYSSEMSSLQAKEKKFEQDYTQAQQDFQNNRYLTQQDMQQKSVSLERRYQELQNSAVRIQQNFDSQMQALSVQLADSLKNVISILNENKRYQMVFINEGLTPIIYAEDGYDITQDALDVLNARYVKEEEVKQ